jgi:hypothetical protein
MWTSGSLEHEEDFLSLPGVDGGPTSTSSWCDSEQDCGAQLGRPLPCLRHIGNGASLCLILLGRPTVLAPSASKSPGVLLLYIWADHLCVCVCVCVCVCLWKSWSPEAFTKNPKPTLSKLDSRVTQKPLCFRWQTMQQEAEGRGVEMLWAAG